MSVLTRFFILVFFSFYLSSVANSSALSPVGNWLTIDDNTNKEKSIVRLDYKEGKLVGTIIRVLAIPRIETPLCDQCPGEFEDQPIIGMRFLWDMTYQDGYWQGGQILDPESGNLYRCKISISEDGQILKVRGFIGLSLFGRTQEWKRYSISEVERDG